MEHIEIDDRVPLTLQQKHQLIQSIKSRMFRIKGAEWIDKVSPTLQTRGCALGFKSGRARAVKEIIELLQENKMTIELVYTKTTVVFENPVDTETVNPWTNEVQALKCFLRKELASNFIILVDY